MNMNEFISLMEKVENPGTFSVHGQLTSVPPGLKVKGLGSVSLPINQHQAKELIKLSDQAPYGRGEETIVDTEVRKVWQISAENFELTNPEWLESLQESVTQMGKQLGLHNCKINFEPYKLLIYEKDSFFTSHRDTEKIPNMFATLVINLPSEHEGGELIVSHGGQSQHYTFADNDGLHPDFVTFYADCYHEVKPIIAGYRICLIYNLAIANREKQPLLADQINVSEQVSQFIQKWIQEKHENPTLTYLLEHSYSEKNLCLANLKNGDFSKASVLLNAAEKNACQAFLCLVTYHRSSYGETPYYGRHSYYNEGELDENDFEEYDEADEEIYAHSFTSVTGEEISIKNFYLEEEELLANIPLLEGEGRECHISEATGNEGASKDLWYHRGAVILWPLDREFEILSKTNIEYKVNFFKTFIQQKKLSADNQQQITQIANAIIEALSPYASEDISQELIVLGNIELLKKLIHKQMKGFGFSRVNNQAFIRIVEFCGWNSFARELNEYLTPQRNVLQWLSSLLLVESLSNESKAMIKKWAIELWKPCLEYRLTQDDLVDLLKLVAVLKMDAVTDEIMAFLSMQQQPLFIIDIYGSALVRTVDELQGRDYDRAILNKFSKHVCEWIQTDFSAPPIKPENWSRTGSLQCDCQFCTQINQFLPDSEQSEISFRKVLKRDLIHIESEINKNRVDLKIVIEKSPPKFDGICSKTQQSYENKLKLFNTAQKIAKALQQC